MGNASHTAGNWFRKAWTGKTKVAVDLDERCEPRKLRGSVTYVAPTDAFCTMSCNGTIWNVPLCHITKYEEA